MYSVNSGASDSNLHDKDRVPESCFHCGLPLPAQDPLYVQTDFGTYRVCCQGCRAASEAIVNAGLGSYYQQRTQAAPKVDEISRQNEAWILANDLPEVQQGYVRQLADHQCETFLILEGLVCPACAWLNEQRLQGLEGMLNAEVNFGSGRVHVRWDSERLRLSRILRTIFQLGYSAQIYSPARWERAMQAEQRTLLRQLGVAWALGMQVMMVAFAVYLVDSSSIEPAQRYLLNGLNFILTLPVVGYSAQAFFRPAWRDLKQGRIGMDLPVSLGILLAFGASLAASLTGSTDTYFDSVVMFVGFLLLGRYIELMARKKAGEALERLSLAEPTIAVRLVQEGPAWREERLRATNLQAGDRVLVRPGERIPADAIVIEGQSSVDEALLTGESVPVSKHTGSSVIGGSYNIESPLQLRISRTSSESVLAQIQALIERAQSERPAITQLADRVAPWFIATVLLVAAVLAGVGGYAQLPGWYENVLAVLVVSCPCALSLAAPTAVAVASNSLLNAGILVRSGRALEALARATHFAFDKTGTLTDGQLRIVACSCHTEVTEHACLEIAVALEAHSEHPIARAFNTRLAESAKYYATELSNFPGFGIAGRVAGKRYYLGSPLFVAEHSRLPSPTVTPPSAHTVVILADEDNGLCTFQLDSTLRKQAVETLATLHQRGVRTSLLTGDTHAAAEAIAKSLRFDNFHAQQLPADKLRCLEALQQRGERVAMIGDGVNDAPVLAAADVSLALASGTDLARASADFVLLGQSLSGVLLAIDTAKRTLLIIRQNLLWALAYNVLTLPAAACGYIPPWLAALGMSLSSLAVTANAIRLRRLNPKVH